MPTELQGILWFGVDDSGTTVRFPIYGSTTKMPKGFAGPGTQDGITPPMMTFDWNTAFYAFNMVANFAYSRWGLIYPELKTIMNNIENMYVNEIQQLDREALEVYNGKGASAAVQMVTDYSVKTGEALIKQWQNVFGNLFVKYRDGYVITANKESTSCGCNVANGYYPQAWYDRIVTDTQDHYLVPPDSESNEPSDKKFANNKSSSLKAKPKTTLKALR